MVFGCSEQDWRAHLSRCSPLLLKAAVCGGEIQLTIGLRHLMDMEDCDGDQGNCKEDSYEEGAGEKDGSEEVNA
jgi:hypothetical protein